MKPRFNLVFCALFLVLLAGCGNLQRQSRSFDTNGTSGITIDASQRAIYSVTKKYQGDVQWTAFCAEPSPDALSALASSFGLDASAAGKALGLAITSQDSTASIGLRTQTIQILRDAMYRLCEGYASGALDQTGFTRLQRRYLHIMLALLAIEQITGPVVAQQVALTGSSGASLGKSLGELAKLLAEAAGKVAKSESELADAKANETDLAKQVAASKSNGTATETTHELEKKLTAARKTVKDKAIEVKSAKAVFDTLETKLKDSERIVLTASSRAEAFVPESSLKSRNTNITEVSSNVESIVMHLVDHDYTKEVCIDALLSKDGDEYINSLTVQVILPICFAGRDKDGKFFISSDLNSLLDVAKERTAAIKAAKDAREKSKKQSE